MKTTDNKSKNVTITLSKEAIEKGKKDAQRNARSFSKHIQWLLMSAKLFFILLITSCSLENSKNSLPDNLTYFSEENLPKITTEIKPGELPKVKYDLNKSITYESGFYIGHDWIPILSVFQTNTEINIVYAYVLRIIYKDELILKYATNTPDEMMNSIDDKIKEAETIINENRIKEMQESKQKHSIEYNLWVLNEKLNQL
jgi:hypothetical protein